MYAEHFRLVDYVYGYVLFNNVLSTEIGILSTVFLFDL